MLKRFLTVSIIGVLLTALPAFAVISSQTQSFSGIPNLNSSLTFNQFNTGLGTLQSIQVLLYLESYGGQLILDNDSTSPASGTFQFGAAGNLNATTDVLLFNSSFQPIPSQVGAYHSQAFSLAADNGDGSGNYDSTGPDGLSYVGDLEGDVKFGFIGNAFWSLGTNGFLGTGTYNINYCILQWLDYGSIGGIEYAVNPINASGHVTIAYTYNPVPEPATIVLLTIGVFASMKRKNKK